jgi:hypothetical protein
LGRAKNDIANCRHSVQDKAADARPEMFVITNTGREFDACLRGTVKLRRAHGGCLGDQRRRRTWTAAKSSGEPLTGFDPEISEWGNPRRDYLPARDEYIVTRQPSQGTETSKYLDESKSKETPLVVASERGRA